MPDWSPDLRPHLARLGLTPEREADILEELSQHLDERFRELMASGDGAADAERTIRSEARAAVQLPGALAALRQARAGELRLEWPGAPGRPAERRTARLLRRCGAELAWAWRAVRSRGWRAAVVVALIAVALAANVLVFAVADSVVFRPVTYPNAQELVEIQRIQQPGGRGNGFMSADVLDAWRQQTDLFASVQAYLTKTVFLVADGQSDIVPAADVTPGLIELLGARPKWGRNLTEGDARETGAIPTLIAARLARERFGSPEAALNKVVETTAQPLLIVGVMPDEFRFPTGAYPIWRVMDPRGPLTRNFAGVHSIARAVPGLATSVLADRMAQRSRPVGETGGAGEGYAAMPAPIEAATAAGPPASRVRVMFLTLVGGAFFLLLTACANVANLEVAGAMHRARRFAVQLALGASPGTLARIVLLEGALLTGAGLATGAALAWLGIGMLEAYVPVAFTRFSVNPIDIDGRALLYMAVIALATWLVASLPTVAYASSSHLLGLLKSDDRSAAQSRRGVSVRRGLTVIEVAIAVILVVGGLLYTRSYLALLRVDKGFDSTNLTEIAFAIPVEYHDQPGEFRAFADDVVARVRTVPGVLAAVQASAPPSTGTPFVGVRMEIDGRPLDGTFTIGDTPVDPAYFQVVGLTLRQGRWLEPGDPTTNVIVTESFARRFWPDRQATGRTFRRLAGGSDLPSAPIGVGTAEGGRIGIVISKPVVPPNLVVGVVSEFRSTRPGMSVEAQDALYYYTPRQPPPPAPPTSATAAPRPASTGGSWRFLNVTVRLDSPARAPLVLEAARSVDRRLRVTMEMVDAKYAEMFGDVLLAKRITTAFSMVAFVVAIVGIYGVMAYLVMGRRQEIGVRMALGAGPGDIVRLVVASSARLVLPGIAIGTAGAIGLAQWTGSQFFGVSAVSPGSYAVVALVVAAAALLATWHPARQAARVDPAVTLKSE